MNVSEQDTVTRAVAELHGVDEITNQPTQPFRTTSESKLNDILESFLEAQYNFHKNFNYTSAAEQKPSFLRFQMWGSNFEKKKNRSIWKRI